MSLVSVGVARDIKSPIKLKLIFLESSHRYIILKVVCPVIRFYPKQGTAQYPAAMGNKSLWPAIATLMPENTREHSHMLGLYIDTTLKLIQDGHRPPAKSFKSFLQALSTFIEKTKQEPNNHVLLEEIRKAADASMRRETFIEKQITTIKNSAPNSNLSYANVASQVAAKKAAAGISLPITTPLPSYNKVNEIIIKLDDKNSAQTLSTQSSENILRDINHYLQVKGISHTDICTARKFRNGDIAIHTANKMETKKLVEEESWTQVLGKKAGIITKTFEVIAHAVCIDSINMKEKEVVMEQI